MSIKEAARHSKSKLVFRAKIAGILDDMVTKVQNAAKWKVMIVDNTTLRIISSCVKMSEIMEKGVTRKNSKI
jgi:hypothetical protein